MSTALRAALAIVLAPTSLTAHQTPPPWAGALDSAVMAVMENLHAPSVAVAVLNDFEIVYAKGYGLANREARIAASERTLYRTASLAKPITATAVFQLMEDGRIDLDAPITQYCPEYPPKRWPITARHLLTHRSGIRHPTDDEDDMTRHFAELRDALVVFTEDRLAFEPGTRYHYSTLGYMLLGCAIEHASGMSYMAFLDERIFAPAGMTQTTRDTVSYENSLRSHGYRRAGRGRIEPSLRVDTSFKLAGGGLVSNVVDLARFARALMTGQLLEQPSLDVMFTPVPQDDGSTPFGAGWQVSISPDDPENFLAYHAGQQQEVSAILLIRPATGYGVVLMTNLERLGDRIVDFLGPIRELTDY